MTPTFLPELLVKYQHSLDSLAFLDINLGEKRLKKATGNHYLSEKHMTIHRYESGEP